MGSRIVTAVGAPEPSRVDGVEDGYSRTSCPRRQRQRQLPSLPPRIGPTIAVTTVAPEAFTEVVDDGGSDGENDFYFGMNLSRRDTTGMRTTATTAVLPSTPVAGGVKDGSGGGTRDLSSRMRSRTATAAAAPEPSRADGIEDSGGGGNCRQQQRRRPPSLPPQIGPTIVAMTVAPEAFAEVVDDGENDFYFGMNLSRRDTTGMRTTATTAVLPSTPVAGGVKDGSGGGTRDLSSRMRSRTATAAAAPEPSRADGIEDSGGGGNCRFEPSHCRWGCGY
ncbi:hypothetical protein OsI_01732 [Oryza sativa Indica Group]|uniref:Uncharacterized protein n=1 Tax=Oryza sativa subsp. indica TaxID=39946 RepID=B8A7G3_ORYSI|nr:hypothetical protein OsI_01732 [Oryza sativa Indica Group]